MPVMPLTLLDLNGTAVHEELHASHKAGVVGSQEDSRFRDLVRLSETAQRHGRDEVIMETLLLFFRFSKTAESGSIDWAGTHNIHTDLPILQICRPSAGEGTHCRFGCRVDAECRSTLDGNLRRVQHDCATAGNQWQGLLDRKKNALYVRVKGLIVVFLSNRSKGGEGATARVDEQHIEAPFVLLDLFVQTIQVRQIRRVGTDGLCLVGTNTCHRFFEFRLATARDEHKSAFLREALRRSQADSGATARDECDLTFQFPCHLYLPVHLTSEPYDSDVKSSISIQQIWTVKFKIQSKTYANDRTGPIETGRKNGTPPRVRRGSGC